MLPKISETKVVVERYASIDGKKGTVLGNLFTPDEVQQAETIVNALKGMDIASARGLLKKISKYLLMEKII